MYDHNQTFVPDSFLALHSKHGRPLLSRDAMEARHEACENVALQLAASLAELGVDAEDSSTALGRVQEGLVADGDAFSANEAWWITQRIAELMEWPQPACGKQEPPKRNRGHRMS